MKLTLQHPQYHKVYW